MDPKPLIPAEVRRYIYALLPAVGALLTYYGFINDSAWQLWAAVISQALGFGLAVSKTADH